MSSSKPGDSTPPQPVIRVMHQDSPPADGSISFLDQIIRESPSYIEHRYFSWKQALLSDYDVLHLHWPEYMLRKKTRTDRLINNLYFIALMLILWVRRVAIVRTLHNVTPHEPGTRIERLLTWWLDRRTALFVRLNPFTPVPYGKPATLIPHGHYIEQFRMYPHAERVPGRFLFIGQIRPVKGIEQLLDAFAQIPDRDLSLRIVGNPLDDALRKRIQAACERDIRMSCRLERVSDADMVRELTEAELVVLPYRHMHNSGILFSALSAGRPVLAPANAVNQWIMQEVGPEWISIYSGRLASDDLAQALRNASNAELATVAPFVRREWRTVAECHAEAYRQACEGADRDA